METLDLGIDANMQVEPQESLPLMNVPEPQAPYLNGNGNHRIVRKAVELAEDTKPCLHDWVYVLANYNDRFSSEVGLVVDTRIVQSTNFYQVNFFGGGKFIGYGLYEESQIKVIERNKPRDNWLNVSERPIPMSPVQKLHMELDSLLNSGDTKCENPRYRTVALRDIMS